ncbi:hypothetical protein HL658_12600 [Azospirillum sp. RWY-5-1]|uniref:Uncharacterized protein n=1 Tax=Azospirillum oleiclasticum TaxID=2735135 RepID=A0ABX2TBZ2_9PROT|nr:MlaA family lipoprotein [Azospirillum oleiclasticum]NYZ13393.1 hypothetical protein [Azospirillum oleiclasticum]NYZ20554.1 hypothetical protein [Azospirillum oleiclasticum]
MAAAFRRTLGVLILLTAFGAGTARADGLDAFNAATLAINHTLAGHVVVPALDAYRKLPPFMQAMGANAYANLTEPVTALSWAMAGEGAKAGESMVRFGINSTAGLLGVMDVASAAGFTVPKKYFSEGVCAAGIPAGRYVEVPGAGASSAGVLSAALAVMVGSTWALSYVSVEVAVASVVLDLVATAAALEGLVASGDVGPVRRQADYMAWLERSGCEVAATAG